MKTHYLQNAPEKKFKQTIQLTTRNSTQWSADSVKYWWAEVIHSLYRSSACWRLLAGERGVAPASFQFAWSVRELHPSTHLGAAALPAGTCRTTLVQWTDVDFQTQKRGLLLIQSTLTLMDLGCCPPLLSGCYWWRGQRSQLDGSTSLFHDTKPSCPPLHPSSRKTAIWTYHHIQVSECSQLKGLCSTSHSHLWPLSGWATILTQNAGN